MPRLRPNEARLTGKQFMDFRDALIDAYNAPGPFGQMLMFNLTKNLPTLTTANGMEQIVFDVIVKAEDQAWTAELLQGARASNPNNPELVAFAQQFGLAPLVYEQTAGEAASDHPIRAPRLEKFIVESNGLKDVLKWRERLGALEAQVCRVEIATGAEPETGGAKNAISGLEARDATAYSLDLPGQFLAQHDCLARLAQSEVDAHGNRQKHRELHAARLAVAGGDRRRTHFDEDLVVLGDRFVHLLQLQNLWWSIPCPNHRTHPYPPFWARGTICHGAVTI